MLTKLRTLFDLFRYYTLSREDYYNCMEKELPSTLYSMWHLSLLLTLSMFNTALRSYIAAFTGGDELSLITNRNLRIGVMFSVVIIVAILFGILVRHLYLKHKQGKTIRYVYIYALGVFNYSLVMGINIYRNVFLDPDTPSIIFAMFMICGLLLIFAPPLFNLTLMLTAMAAFIFVTITYMAPQYRAAAIDNAVFAVVVGIFFTWCVNVYRAQAASNGIKLEEQRKKLDLQATIDILTGVHNRRYFIEHANIRLQECARFKRESALILFDIDKFKSVNDTYGHAAGDAVICAVAEATTGQLRPYDLFARYGGEEFIVFLPETGASTARKVAERLRKIVENHVTHFQSKALNCTISLGVAANDGGPVELNELINAADRALYRAKEGGRNRVEIA